MRGNCRGKEGRKEGMGNSMRCDYLLEAPQGYRSPNASCGRHNDSC